MNKNVLKDKIINYSIKKWKLFCYISIVLFVVVIAGGSIYLGKYYNFFKNDNASGEMESQDAKKICENCVRRVIDGVYVETGKENFWPIAVVIDNNKKPGTYYLNPRQY